MNAAALRSRLIEWRNPSFVHDLRQLRDEDQFQLLWPIAIAAQEEANLSFPAAALLLDLNPPCPLSIADAIVGLFAGWDVSIEEVPWYLARQFGRTAVARVAADLRVTRPDPVERQILDTVVYWVNLPKAPNGPSDAARRSSSCAIAQASNNRMQLTKRRGLVGVARFARQSSLSRALQLIRGVGRTL